MALSAAGWLGGLTAAHAVSITLTQPFQPGDYFASGNSSSGGGDQSTLYQIRPSNLAGSRVLSTITVGSGVDTENVYGTFRSNGDFYYSSGVSGGNKGFELWRIPAGATIATQVISNLHAGTGGIYSVAVATDGTAYALQTDGKVRKWVPDGGGNYTTGTTLPNTMFSSLSIGSTIRLSADDKFLLGVGSVPGSPLASVDTTSGTVSTVADGATGPFSRPLGFDIDYANGLNGGSYRVLVSSINSFTGDGSNKRVTEVAFNPSTGIVTNPFSGGTGNLSGLGAGLAESYLRNSSIMDQIAFDNDGNLIALNRANSGKTGASITQAQLDAHTSTTAFSSFPEVWGSGGDGVSMASFRSFDIAPVPVPEPSTLAMLLFGTSMLFLFRRKRSA